MKLNRKDYAEAKALGESTLRQLGVDMEGPDDYDCATTGKRYSVFRGRISAVWDDAHFKTMPLGYFKLVGVEIDQREEA